MCVRAGFRGCTRVGYTSASAIRVGVSSVLSNVNIHSHKNSKYKWFC